MVFQSGIWSKQRQSIAYGFPNNGKWPEQGQKLHIWFSKVESGLNKGQSIIWFSPFKKWPELRAKHHIWLSKVDSDLNRGN
jgi:hypothetical protein